MSPRSRRFLAFLLGATSVVGGAAQARPRQEQPLARLAPAGLAAGPTVGVAAAPSPEPAVAAAPGPDWSARIGAELERLAAAVPPAAAGAAVDGASGADPALQRALAGLGARGIGRGEVAIHVRDLDSGAVLFDQHGDRLMNPASNQKLVTATAAAELLGPDYRFETRVERRGDALVLVGEGDPGLQLAHLYELAAAVVRSGAAEGATRLLVDDAAFSARTYGPGYGPEGDGDAYTAPSSALSLHWNTVRVTVRPGPSGHAPEVTVEPPSAHVIVDNRAKTGGRADLRVRSEARGDQTAVVVEGTLPGGHRPMQWFRRVHDPAAFTGHAFARLVHEVGGPQLPVARLDAEPSLDRTSAARVVATHQSPPLSELLESALKFSNNFTTEQVLRTLAWRATGRPGSWVDGREVLRQWWSATGHGDAAIVLHNGSGLSRKGRVRARDLVDVVARSSAAGAELPELVAALPAAGRDGTLRRRMGAAHGRIRAKTGTMGGVSSLSGVVVSEGGQRRVGFSVIVNDAGDLGRARALQDRVALAILRRIDALDPAS